jgi:hypothetical protein
MSSRRSAFGLGRLCVDGAAATPTPADACVICRRSYGDGSAQLSNRALLDQLDQQMGAVLDKPVATRGRRPS